MTQWQQEKDKGFYCSECGEFYTQDYDYCFKCGGELESQNTYKHEKDGYNNISQALEDKRGRGGSVGRNR